MRETTAVNPNSTGIILEGVCASGKSTVLDGLLKNEAFLERGYASAVVLTEHHTQRVLEARAAERGLCVEDNLALLDQNLGIIRTLDRRLIPMGWGEAGRQNHRFCYVLERFHLTHVCHYEHVKWDHVMSFDEELAYLGCKMCVLHVSESAMRARFISLQRSPAWTAYLKTVGSDEDEITAHYLRQQERLMALADASAMPTLVVDTSEKLASEVVAEVLAFWQPGKRD